MRRRRPGYRQSRPGSRLSSSSWKNCAAATTNWKPICENPHGIGYHGESARALGRTLRERGEQRPAENVMTAALTELRAADISATASCALTGASLRARRGLERDCDADLVGVQRGERNAGHQATLSGRHRSSVCSQFECSPGSVGLFGPFRIPVAGGKYGAPGHFAGRRSDSRGIRRA